MLARDKQSGAGKR